MTILTIILLILLGLVLLLLEFAVIPGVTIAGIGGVVMLIASVYMAFSKYGVLGGVITLMAILATAPFLFYHFFKTRAGKRMILDTNILSKVDAYNLEKIRPGDTGVTLGRLAPSGKVRVNGEVVEARSSGTFIDHNKPVRVAKIGENKIVVELIKTE